VGNTIGGTPGLPNASYGIYNNAANAVILRNSIDGGLGCVAVTGIDNEAGSIAQIYDNIIHAGVGQSGDSVISTGIWNVSSSATIQCNTIDIGNPGTGSTTAGSVAIGVTVSTCSPVIDDNIVFSDHGIIFNQTQYGIVEQGASSSPNELRNNDIYNCPDALYVQSTTANLTAISAVNSLPGSGNNVSTNPSFKQMTWTAAGWTTTDWHLTSSTPAAVTQGGETLSGTDLGVDRDGIARTVPWSIGAYQ